MSIGKLEAPQMLTALAAAVCLAAAALLFDAIFSQVSVEGTSLAIDWRGVHKDFAGGTITYYNGLRNPPWSVLPLLPLGLLSMGASWGLLIFFTFLVLVISVPRHPRRAVFWLSVLLLMVGYRARQPYLLAGGMLLASAKPHEAVLLLAVVALYLWQTWPPGEWLKAAGAAALVVGLTLLWRGGEWFGALTGTYQQGSIMDISLWTALTRTGLVAPAVRALLWGGRPGGDADRGLAGRAGALPGESGDAGQRLVAPLALRGRQQHPGGAGPRRHPFVPGPAPGRRLPDCPGRSADPDPARYLVSLGGVLFDGLAAAGLGGLAGDGWLPGQHPLRP